jgi:simple sugar transport system permease protein
MNNNNKLIGFLLRNRIAGTLAILVAVVVIATLYSHDNNFIRVANLKNLGTFGPEFGIVALGVGLLMIAGEFDLSVGSVLAFCALVFTWTNELSINPFIGLLITLAAGVMTGLISGVITVKGKIVSFITTLGAMMFWRGLTLMLSRGEMQAVHLDDYPLFMQVFTGEWFGFLPAQAFWFLLLVIILTLVLHSRRFGNWIFSTGDNALAARAMAINTDRVKTTTFIIVGVLTAFAAVLQTTRLSAFSSRVGTGWELSAIAAAVVGGTSLRGGIGNMIGIFLGALIIIVIENALVLARLPYEWTFMVFGIVILFSVLLDLFIEKRVQRSASY